jgi:sugar O-acyltransferase (sialic acid O-acetyltransferase NeuD family)
MCLDLDRTIAGFVDEARAGETVRGYPAWSPHQIPTDHGYVVAIADPEARRRLVSILDGAGARPANVLHRLAYLTPGSTHGDGLLLQAHAFVSSSVRIGAHCQVHYNATIGHDAVLDDLVTVYPGANISGNVHLGEGVTVGSNAVVLQGLSVGAGAFVGAGAVVTRDVEPGVVVMGNPARPRPTLGRSTGSRAGI